MAHVFISYHKQSSRDYARKLADYLIASGFDVWIDDRIDLGSRWEREIYKAIEGCRAFVVIMTPGAWESEWVNREYLYADSLKKPPFPLLLDGGNFPFYAGVQFTDVRDGSLPPEHFFDLLERTGVPRKATPGAELAAAPQAVARHAPAPMPPGEASAAASPPPTTSTTNSASRVRERRAAAARRAQQRSLLSVVAAVMLLTLGVCALLFVPGLLRSSATPTLSPTRNLTSAALAAVPTTMQPSTVVPLDNLDTLPTPTPPVDAPSSTIIPFGGLNTLPPTVDLATQVWLDLTLTADAWTDTPTHTFTPSLTFTPTFTATSTPNMTETYAALALQRDLTLTAFASTPNGGGRGQIVYMSGDDNTSEIYVMNVDGSNARALTSNSVSDRYPYWSPDGTQIVFDTNRNGNFEIYVMDADGSNPRNLTNSDAGDYMPAWSPDGSQIVFESDRTDTYLDLFIMNADGSGVSNLTNSPDKHEYYPVWSPDGTQIAYLEVTNSTWAIHVVAPDGSNPHSVISSDEQVSYLAWSPDGTQIAYSRADGGERNIYVMNADGSNQRRVTTSSIIDDYPAWSPDGTQILFSSNRSGNNAIYVISADGSKLRQLTSGLTIELHPHWRP